jgi:hypothetical protein
VADVRGDLVDLSINSSSNAKVDFFLEAALDYRVQLLEDGGARGRATVRFANQAPTEGQPRYVIGPARPGFEAGENRLFATLACAVECTFDGYARDGQRDDRVALDREQRHQLLTAPVALPSGGTETIEATWFTPAGTWDAVGRRLTYRLTLRTPPAVTPTGVTVTVMIPEGMRVARAPGMDRRQDAVVFTGAVRGTQTLEIDFVPYGPVRTLVSSVRTLMSQGDQIDGQNP